MAGKVLTGAIAIIKVNGQAVGKMRTVTINENFQRIPVPKGLGSIFDDEMALVKFNGTVSCSQVEIDYRDSGLPGGVRRIFGSNIASQIAAGNNLQNFEDEAVLDFEGITVDLFKKIQDAIDPATNNIIPGAIPYATIGRMFIESDNVSINEQNVAGRDQTYRFLDPVTQDV